MCLAVPGKIISIEGTDPMQRLGQIDFSGVRKKVSLAYVPEAAENDYVIVHAGFAISLIDEMEAEATLKSLRELSALDDPE